MQVKKNQNVLSTYKKYNKVTTSTQRKISILLVLIASVLIFLYVQNYTDAFFGNHLARMDNIVNSGTYIPGKELASDATGVYNIYGAIISIILGLEITALFEFPLVLLGIAPLFYVLYKMVSKNYFVSSTLLVLSLITLALFQSYLTFWTHAIGLIYLLLYLLLLHLYTQKKVKIANLILLLTIVTVAIINMSYDMTGILAIMLASVFILTLIRNLGVGISNNNALLSPKISIILIIIFSGFIIYNSFIENMFLPYMSEYFSLSRITEFITELISRWQGNSSTVLNPLLFVQSNKLLTILNYTRYLTYLFVFISFIIIVCKKYGKSILNDDTTILLLSTIICFGGYAVLRVAIGSHSGLTYIFIPAMLCLSYIFSEASIPRKTSISICENKKSRLAIIIFNMLLICMLFSIFGYTGCYVATMGAGLNNVENLDSYTITSEWISSYSTYEIASDIFTKNMLLLTSILANDEKYYLNLNKYYLPLYLSDVEGLIYHNQQNMNSLKNIVINTNLQTPGIGDNWERLYSWNHYLTEIDSNNWYNTIYDTKKLMIYSPSK